LESLGASELGRCSVLLLLLGFASATGRAEVLEGRVVAVADGDTITLLDRNRQQHKIRLAGIDAPEKAQPCVRADSV
jgi:endonuclease YncB( thermonuclease family)